MTKIHLLFMKLFENTTLISEDLKPQVWVSTQRQLFLLFSLFFLIEVELIYNVILVSGVEQSDSATYFLYSFPLKLLQDIAYNPLCCTIGPCLFMYVSLHLPISNS